MYRSFVRTTVTVAAAGGLGVAIVLAAGASVAGVALVLLMLGLVAVVAWSGDATRTRLYAFALTAPIAITKSIVQPNSLYPPALEARLCDIPFVLLCALWIRGIVLEQQRPWPPDLWGRCLLLIAAWAWISGLSAEHRVEGAMGAIVQTKFVLQCVLTCSLIDTPRVLR